MKTLKLFTFIMCTITQLTSAHDYVFFSPEMIQSHLKSYTEEEKTAIENDKIVVRQVCFDGAQNNKSAPRYLATAGGPGSRKSTVLERFLHASTEYSDAVYLDPDVRGLKYMVNTYYARSLCPFVAAQHEDYSIVLKNAYEKWRSASNYIAVSLIEEAFKSRYDIVHGTTSTGTHIADFLKAIKETGYEITLLLCSCDMAFREQAIHYRNNSQKFYQSTEEEMVTKGKQFPQRMQTYFAYADTLYLIWSDSLATPERIAAIWKNKQLYVMDMDALERFVMKYENDRDQLKKEGIDIPSWSELLIR